MWLKFWGFGFVFFNLIPLFNFAVMVFFWSCGEGAVFLCCPLGAAVRLVVFAPEHRTKGSQWGFECMGQMEELKTHRYPVQGKRGAAVFLRSWELFSWPLGRGDVERPWLIWLWVWMPKAIGPSMSREEIERKFLLPSCSLPTMLKCRRKKQEQMLFPLFFLFWYLSWRNKALVLVRCQMCLWKCFCMYLSWQICSMSCVVKYVALAAAEG